jgi:Uma2 family endonuclease
MPPGSTQYLVPPFPVRRFTVDEYHRLIQGGFFAADERFELLDGWITPKTSRNPPHDFSLTRASGVLRVRLPSGWDLRGQCAVTLATSEPEPDLALVLAPLDRYRARHPGPADVGLLVEVSDSTLDSDRNVKGPLYAQAGIEVYWIVNLVDTVVEVYTMPSPTGYLQRQDYTLADAIPLVLGGQLVGPVPVVELLG